MVVLAVTWMAKTGRESEVTAIFEKLSAESRKEPGSLMYQVHKHKTDPRRFFIYQLDWQFPRRCGQSARGQRGERQREKENASHRFGFPNAGCAAPRSHTTPAQFAIANASSARHQTGYGRAHGKAQN